MYLKSRRNPWKILVKDFVFIKVSGYKQRVKSTIIAYILSLEYIPCIHFYCWLFIIFLIARLVIVAKGFLKLPNLHMLIKQKSPPLPRNLPLRSFGILLIVFSTKANLLYLLYSTAQRCSLLHLIRQNCLLKTFLRTLIQITQVSLYLLSLLQLVWNCIIFL